MRREARDHAVLAEGGAHGHVEHNSLKVQKTVCSKTYHYHVLQQDKSNEVL